MLSLIVKPIFYSKKSIKYSSNFKVIRQFLNKMGVKEVASNKSFGGYQKVYEHESEECKCMMRFGVYFPPQAETKKCPVLYYLSGLTCTEQNVVTKGGTQGPAAKNGIIIVTPDTSPRGCKIDGEDDSYDFGSGAGFYVDATEPKWKTNYRMYSYVTKELVQVINSNFTSKVDADKMSVFGHSMGGHGALVLALKQPGKYKSVSAFAPITNPTQCGWGQKALGGYLGTNKSTHEEYDSCHLVRKYKGPKLEILVDQGSSDQFLQEQLLPDHFVTACADAGMPLQLRIQEGYDHSYFFMSSFMEDHINHHAKFLNA
ncbi:S-formylglutathione hydrolase-like [Clavelina lepadiformis]|uniref:S-formylglutathione hydrolase n=1 Tax=Clavelina lepadiformis TaxID=159417 RepID=A0ABP0H0K1_CLALP